MKLENYYETETQELKKSLGELDKGILSLTAMLNKSGKGKILFGVDDSGEIVGLDNNLGKETIKKISTRVSELVRPVIIPKIYFENYDDKMIIVLEAEGHNRPYSSGGEYRVRSGSENKKIDPSILSEIVFSNSTSLMDNVEAINQDLTFEQLKGLYLSHGLSINSETFTKNCGLLTKNGTYNYLAEVLSDNNNCSIKVVRFSGLDKLKMLSRNEFGYRCLLLSMKAAYDFVTSLNEVRVDIDSDFERKETSLFNLKCFEEAWTNACLHNKWVKNVPPAIYIYDDRMEIISTGGLPYDFSKSDFYSGLSHPINPGLQKIMGQLDMIEQTGHGVPLIVSVYGTQAFEITESHIKVTIPFSFEPSFRQISTEGLSEQEKRIVAILQNHPTVTLDELSAMINLSKSRLSDIIKKLKNTHKIERIGKTKGGYWKVY